MAYKGDKQLILQVFEGWAGIAGLVHTTYSVMERNVKKKNSKLEKIVSNIEEKFRQEFWFKRKQM